MEEEIKHSESEQSQNNSTNMFDKSMSEAIEYDEEDTDQEIIQQALPLDSSEDLEDEGVQYLLQVRQEAMGIQYNNPEKQKQIIQKQEQKQQAWNNSNNNNENKKKQNMFQALFQRQEQIQQIQEQQSKVQLSQQDQEALKQFQNLKDHIGHIKKQLNEYEIEELIENYQGISLDFLEEKKSYLENFNMQQQQGYIEPKLQILVQVEYVKLEKLIQYSTSQFLYQQKNERIGSYQQFSWVYSLLALLEKPVIFELCDSMIKILRYALYCQEQYDKEKEDYQSYYYMCQLVILIIREYFEQRIYA